MKKTVFSYCFLSETKQNKNPSQVESNIQTVDGRKDSGFVHQWPVWQFQYLMPWQVGLTPTHYRYFPLIVDTAYLENISTAPFLLSLATAVMDNVFH